MLLDLTLLYDGGQIEKSQNYLAQDLVDNIIQPEVFLRNLKNNPNIGRLPLETGLTFSFTLPPIPPSVSDLKIEKVKAWWGLDLEVCVFNFLFGIFPSNFCHFSFLLLLKFKHAKLLSHFHSLTIFYHT